ncbi:nucleotidyltransferase family protein [uncultured Ruminococcus sp.]|uniref:tRNA(Met) cytidine acetate ligase n=1 Tax=uncultured Ruminococcus sp. TaxID=165186 RepID=UPI00292F581C|nr:nucleotidyltransferase family protein [uncultured Ruminococcus sp.]
MSRAGVICEFNPFHNGHKFLLEKIKSNYADEIVCIMSGSFVQRGDIAITDKYARTKAALANGADMVVELPTVYALSSAQRFAENGVHIAAELQCDTLCFGSENSIEELYQALEILDSEAVQRKIAQEMRNGGYYPRALSNAVGKEYAEIIGKPNNILAIEYIRACRRYNLTPVAIPRNGVEHDSETISGNIASATMIRQLIKSGRNYTLLTPMHITHAGSLERIESAILYRLKTIKSEELKIIADVNEGLENRIIEISKKYNSIIEILEHTKTKRYIMARLRRILCCAVLGITEQMQLSSVPYIRVLGVKENKKHLIQTKSLPLIVDVRRGYDLLDDAAKEIFDIDIIATELMNIASDQCINEFTQGVIKL